MSRLIDADKLDEEVMHLFIAITGNPKQSIIVDECKKSFRNIIDEQPTVELPETAKWIPCSERLPDESGTYIVSAIDGNILRVSFAKWMPRLRTWALNGSRSYWKVKAWMPFPDSYKPEGEIV